MKKLPVILALFLSSFLLTVYAVWIATDNFDTYSVGAALNTVNAGSNWTAAWVSSGFTTETAPAGGQGGIAARKTGTGTLNATRTFTAISAGLASWEMRVSVVPSSDQFVGVTLSTVGADRMLIKMTNGGNIAIWNNSAYATIQAYSVDTWYRIDVEFDDAVDADQYRARVNGGSWTSFVTVNGGALVTVNTIELVDVSTNSHTFDVDDIRAVPVAGGAAPLFKRYYDLLRN